MLDLNIEYYIVAIIVLYIPFHLLEEALGNFPLWMHEHKYMPVKKTYGFWMAGNLFFYYPLLLLCAFVSFFAGVKLISAGLAVLIWGGLNFCEHLFFSVKDGKVSPGLYTSVLFAAVCVLGIHKAYIMGCVTPITLLFAVLIALICAVLPAPLQKYAGNILWKNFS